MPSNFNSTTPAAPAGFTNVVFQTDGNGNDSAYVPTSSGGPGGSSGDIQFNNGAGGFGGSAATINTAGSITIPEGQVIEWSGGPYSTAAISALASDTLAIGDGSPGDVSGAAAMTALILFGSSSYYDYNLFHTTIYSGAEQNWSLILPPNPGTSGQVLTTNGSGVTYWETPSGGGGGGGSVTSFSSGNLSPLFTTSVATPTTTPVLSFSLNTQNANTVFAGPASGGAATPTFRSLVTADLPQSAIPALNLPNSVTAVQVFGDSISVSYGIPQPSQGWAYLVAAALNLPIGTNYAVSGYTVGQIFGTVAGYSPSTSSVVIGLPGSNDIQYCTSAALINTYISSVQALAAWLGLPASQKATGSSITYSGSGWISYTENGLAGKYTAHAGDTATATVTGTTVYIGGWVPISGTYTFSVTIDGVSQGTQTINPYSYNTEWLLRFSGLSSGSHTVVLTFAGSGSDATVQWFGGNGSGSGLPPVCIGNVIPRTGFSNTTIASMNSGVQSAITQLAADGLNVQYINDNSAMPQSTYAWPQTQADGIHPTPYGHMLIASAWLTQLYSTEPSYPAYSGAGGDFLAQVLNAAGITPAMLLAILEMLISAEEQGPWGATATSATAGSATLPSAPGGFLSVTINGNTCKIPYYGN